MSRGHNTYRTKGAAEFSPSQALHDRCLEVAQVHAAALNADELWVLSKVAGTMAAGEPISRADRDAALQVLSRVNRERR